MQITDFTGAVTTPSDSGWDEARQAFNLAVDQRPEAVLRPASAADVAAAVRYAAAEGLGDRAAVHRPQRRRPPVWRTLCC